MSAYYMRDGILYTTKTMCNLVEFWQHEARVYPDEARAWVEGQMRSAELMRPFVRDYPIPGANTEPMDWEQSNAAALSALRKDRQP